MGFKNPYLRKIVTNKSSWKLVETVQEVYYYCKNCDASKDKRVENFCECPCPDCDGHISYRCGVCGQLDPEYISALAERLIRKL